MLAGLEAADDGDITIGSTVQMSYVDQNRDDLDAESTVYEEITGGDDHVIVGNARCTDVPMSQVSISKAPINRSRWESCLVVTKPVTSCETSQVGRQCSAP